jgi:hypothetical protein
MNLALLAPLGLAALASLLVPLLLHLARRTPQRRTEFAALRWLSSRLRPRRRVRMEEPWLLLLRLLLVACIALLFARPVWTVRDAGTPWVLVHPAIGANAARAALADADDSEWRWLAPGFPRIDSPLPTSSASVSSLLREADAQLASGTRLAVLVPRILDGLDAERPRLARGVRWIVVPGARPAAQVSSKPSPPLVLALRGAEAAPGRRYLRAAARANGWRLDEGAGGDAIPAQARVVLWLDASAPPAALLDWARRGGTLWLAAEAPTPAPDMQVTWRDDDGTEVARRSTLGGGQLLQWRQPLRPEALPLLLEPEFPRDFAQVLPPAASEPTRADADAVRPRTGAAAYVPPPRPLDAWLVWLALALFAAERFLATRPGRSASA